MKIIKKLAVACLSCVLLASAVLPFGAVAAGTQASDRANNIFVYTGASDAEAVLLKVIPFDTLVNMSHGVDPDDAASHYYQTYIDAYPCPTYKEGKGVTIPELLEYVQTNSTVENVGSLTYEGSDKLYFKSTDGASANYTYDALLGAERYYYPNLPAYWSLDDAEVSDVDAVLAGGIRTDVYLATSAAGGRILAGTENVSTGKQSLASKIEENNGELTGVLADELTDEEALTLCFGQTAGDITNSTATYSNVKKWVYSIRLKESATSPVVSLGTVANPTCIYTLDGTTLTMTLSCDDTGASIYYSQPGAGTTCPVNLYTDPVTIENYDSADPFEVGFQAVREGYVSSEKVTKSSSEITEADDAPAFTYALTGGTTATVGTDYTATASLTSDTDCPLYACQYQLIIPAGFTFKSVSALASGWEYGIGAEGTATALTFTYLDAEGASSLTADTPLNIANITLTPVSAGSAGITVGKAIVSRETAVAYQDVTAAGLDVNISAAEQTLKGDVNGDGSVDVIDAVRLRKHIAGLLTLAGEQLEAADTTADGVVDIIDAVRLDKYLAGIIAAM